MPRLLALLTLACLATMCGRPAAVLADPFTDATGRSVAIPDRPARVLPAGPPAAILLMAVAPDVMLGWPMTITPEAAGFLSPEAAGLPTVPRLTGKEDVTTQVVALHPDLILDYGDIAPRYADLAKRTEAATHVPTVLLDGALARTPAAFRDLGRILGRPQPADALARLAEAVLAGVPQPAEKIRVVYARGEDGLTLVRPGSVAADVFAVLGWNLLVPPGGGEGPFRQATVAEIAALDPDVIIFAEPQVAARLKGAAEWRDLRAVKDHLAFTAPRLPFGWVEEPPSVNRLLGVAWLSGDDAGSVGALLGQLLYGHLPNADQLATLREQVHPIAP